MSDLNATTNSSTSTNSQPVPLNLVPVILTPLIPIPANPIQVTPNPNDSIPTMTTTPLPATPTTPNPPWSQHTCADVGSVHGDTGFQNLMASSANGIDVAAAVITKASLIWDNGTVLKYSYHPKNPGTANQQGKVDKIIQIWETYANIRFQLVKYDPAKPADIRVIFDPNGGSWCYIAQQLKNIPATDPTTNLGCVSLDSNITSDDTGVILHEFGHALGFMHEHQSPIRGGTITLKPDVIEFYGATQGRTPDQVKQEILDVYKLQDDGNFSALDLTSIMMYFLPAEMNMQGIDVPPNNKLSDTDKAFAFINYPYPGASPFDPTWTMGRALAIAGVDAAHRTQILQAYAKQDWKNVRYYFTLFCTEARTASLLQNTVPTDSGNPAENVPNPFDEPDQDLFVDFCDDAPQQGVQAPTQKPASVVLPPTSGPFLSTLLKNLQDLFSPASGQILALQFPSRFLQQDLYTWDTSTAGIHGQFVKPTVVNENEFRLVDQLYNVGSVIGAPNGINLSIVYEQCLNNLLPGFQSSASTISKQQGRIRQWLLKDVPLTGWVKDLIGAQHSGSVASSGIAQAASSATLPATGGSDISAPQFAVANKLIGDSVNRMELAEALMQEYLSAKQAWELERDNLIKSATPATLDDITRRLTHITTVLESQLASKYADAVVRGYSHTIRAYLGNMDIKSPSEFLQDAKDALRESATSSLDGSFKVYPVQMQPIDWFQGLSTSFSLEDLTQDPYLIEQQIYAKSQQLDVLNSRLAALQLSPKTDLDVLQKQLNAAENAYDGARADLTSAYSSNIISLAQNCISPAGVLLDREFEATAALFQLAPTDYAGIADAMKRVSDAQSAVTKASRAVFRLLSAQAPAKATDTENTKTKISLEITAITKDIAELTARRQTLWKGSTAAANASPSTMSIDDVPILPSNITPSGGSKWQDIVLHHMISSKFTLDTSSSSGSTSRTDCGLFLFSSQSEASTASASSGNSSSESNFDAQIGFRATLVTVDRGGWFQPQIFKQSNGFYHIDENVSWSKWPAGIMSMDDLKTRGETAYSTLNQYLLPAFPVGFIICKDITIKIAMSSTNMANALNFEQTLAKSTGILCFSTSSSETTSSSSKSYSFQATSDGIIIRIPGPQILGYFLQLTEPDQTSPVPNGFLNSDSQHDSVVTPSSLTAKPT